MMQHLQMYNFDCQFRSDNSSPTICKYQSLKLGHIVSTSNFFCNLMCPKNVYLYGEHNIDFIKTCFHRRYNKEFIYKVINKYNTKTIIKIPEIWNDVNYTFIELLKPYDWFIDVGLTGSITVDGVTNHKDIDIIIYINDIDKYVSWNKDHILPKTINNLKIDYYIHIDPYPQFFVSLWPNQNKIIINEKFANNIICPENYTIVYKNDINLECLE